MKPLIGVILLFGACLCGASADEPVNKIERWSGDVSIDKAVVLERTSVTVAPGTVVRLSPGADITIGRGAALTAIGSEQSPISIRGDGGTAIRLSGGSLVMEHCQLSKCGNAKPSEKPLPAITGRVGSDGIQLTSCRFDRCGAIDLVLDGRFQMRMCDLRRSDGLSLRGKGHVTVEANAFQSGRISASRGEAIAVRDNIVIDGGISVLGYGDAAVTGNYVNQTGLGGQVLSFAEGDIRDNVFRGGTWVSGKIGGTIAGNVFISLPVGEHSTHDAFNENCTHEHICGLKEDSLVERNIFVGPSYGAIMGIGANTMTRAVIRQNTFDMHGHGNPIYMNHLVKSDPVGIEIYNNIFMRCGGIKDEAGIRDSTSFIDHNLWADAGAGKPGRFWQVSISDQSPGESGFGGNDVPRLAEWERPLPATDIISKLDVVFPFTDAELLSRAQTVDDILAVYRTAYSPRRDSSAVDAGIVRGINDTAVVDGQPDIGAVEVRQELQ